jgi:hypothetical protein
VGYLPHFGPRFWDLSFKGERIAYELSMQEAMTSAWLGYQWWMLLRHRHLGSKRKGLSITFTLPDSHVLGLNHPWVQVPDIQPLYWG